MSHRRPYDRADQIADGICRILTFLAAVVFAGYIARAIEHFEKWKWMVGR